MVREILFKFFEGNATREEQNRIKCWIEESESNRFEFFRERKLFDSLILLSREKKVKREVFPSFFFLLREITKVAAVVFITLIISYFLIEKEDTEELLGYQSIEVPAGQRINLTLPDGTIVWLNAETKITYPMNFGKEEREVFLDGEAYFEVTSGNNQPFVVKTTLGSVEVLGTKFNVQAYSSVDAFETVLMEGKVKVFLNANPDKYLYLEPSQKASYKNGVLERHLVDDFNQYLWREGLISFKDEPIEQLLATLESYYKKKIVLQNPRISQYKYTGKFRHNDGIEYALKVLQKDLKFSYKWDDETQTIYIR